METSELLKKVRKIEIKTRGLSRHLFSGEYHSAFKGRGMSFSEVRDYQYGDDVRNIDWNVTARTGTPHVKIFEEERELTVMLLIDMSPSSFFGTVNQLKNEIITEICAVLAFSAINNNDKVGVAFFANEVELFIPPKKGRSHVLRIIRELLEYQPQSKKTSIANALEFLSGVMKKKAIVFMMSDFMDSDYEKTLRIVAKKHDLTGIRIYDRHEESIPNIGLVPMLDNETGQTAWVNTQSAKVRKAYALQYKTMVDGFENLFHKNGAGTLHSRLDESYVKKLLNYFKSRG